MANLGQGQYFNVGQSGDAIAITTPFDKKMAMLSKKLDETRMHYGTEEELKLQRKKDRATKKLHRSASPASQARRAEFNLQKSGKINRLGKNELVDDVSSGKVDLDSIDKRALPEAIRVMPKEEQLKTIQEQATIRHSIMGEMKKLSEKRNDYIRNKMKDSASAEVSLDEKLYKTIRQQAAEKGLKYKSDSAAY